MNAAIAEHLALQLFPSLMIVAGTCDVLDMRIPNRIVVLIGLLFLPTACLGGMPVNVIGQHLATAAVFLAAGFVLFARGIIGGGDGKLLAVAGLWLGIAPAGPFLFYTALAGGAFAFGVGVWFMTSMEASMHSDRLGKLFSPLTPSLPYGLPIAIGAILALPHSWWLRVLGG